MITQCHCPTQLMGYRGGRYSFHETPETSGWILMNWCEKVQRLSAKVGMWETMEREWISVLKGQAREQLLRVCS